MEQKDNKAQCRNEGQNRGKNKGQHQGRCRNKAKHKAGAMGQGGTCYCTECGYEEAHQRGVKCTTVKCPECGHHLTRKELSEA